MSSAKERLRAKLQQRKQLAEKAKQAIPVHTGELKPLSFAQQRLWFISQMTGPSAVYNMPLAMRLRGELQLPEFTRALETIIQRHEILRTRFTTEQGQAVQRVSAAEPLHLQVETVSDKAELSAIWEQEQRHLFDLTTDRLLRIRLLSDAPQSYVLLVTMHHIISDGWSLGVFFGELVTLYQAYCADQPAPLPPLPIQYSDFAHWQRQQLSGEALERQLDYWRQQLSGLPPVLELPTDYARPAEQRFRGDAVSLAIDAELAGQLQSLSRDQGVTRFVLLLSAFATLLRRYSGQDDFAIGTPVANRDRAETEGLIGFFVNNLVLRCQFDDNPRFSDFLQQMREVSVQGYAHQDIPFEHLVEALNPERSLSHSPLFQVSFSLLNQPLQRNQAGDLAIEPASLGDGEAAGVARYDITFNLSAGDDGISGGLEYNTDLFEAATIERLLKHYVRLLQGIVADPQARISDYPLLDESERQQLLVEWNPRQAPVGDEQCLHQAFEQQAASQAQATALRLDGQSLSYGELNRRANQVAHYLRAQGVGPDTLVGLCAERSFELLIGLLGILKAGGAYVPIDPANPQDRIDYIVNDAGLEWLLSQRHLNDKLSASSAQCLWLDDSAAWSGQADSNPDHSAQNPDHLAYVIYTSGSTGGPKGVLVEHRQVMRLFGACHSDFHFSDQDVWTLFHSYAFDFSVWEIWGALLYGGRLVIVPGDQARSPQSFYQLLQDEGVTILNQTPTVFKRLIEEDSRQQAELSLRAVVFGGEALDLASLQPWVARHGDDPIALINMYGITETTVHVTYRRLWRKDIDSGRGSVIGRALSDLELYVLDAQLEPVPVGVEGEIYVGGAGLARGYLKREALTRERFIEHPYRAGERLYRTGDVARWTNEGELEYRGRIDHQVKIRGYRIELGEIEAALQAQGEVRNAVVLAREDEPGHAQLVGYVVSEGEAPEDLVLQLRQRLEQRLPAYMVPAAILVLEALPVTGNGKLDRSALPAPDSSALARGEYVAPRNELEQQLAELWQANLGVEQVGVEDNYFALGGDSIRSISLAAEAKAAGLNLSIKDLFAQPTIAGLAQVLAAGAAAAEMRKIGAFELLQEDEREALQARWGEQLEDAYPLSMLQQGMVFHSMQNQQVAIYHDLITYRIDSRWDEEAFKQASQHLAQVHAVFRTVFSFDGARPLQAVLRQVDDRLKVHDWRQRDDHEAAFDNWAKANQRDAFDWSEPLWRIDIHQLADEAFQFSLTVHHAVLDGWSVSSVVTQLFTVYRQLLQQQALPEIPQPPPYQYFIAEELQALDDETIHQHWQQTLRDVHLPWWSGGEKTGSHRHINRLPDELSSQLSAWAREQGVQERSVWCAIYLMLIALLDGSDDITGSIVTHGRPEIPGGEHMLGLFLNSMPVRINLQGMSWQELVRAVDRQLLEQHRLRHYPLAAIQQHSGLDFSSSLFNYTNFHVYGDSAGDTDISGAGGHDETNYLFELNVHKLEQSKTNVVEVRGEPTIFSEAMVRRAWAYVENILQALLEQPGSPISRRPLLGADEWQWLMHDWQGQILPYPQDICIQQLFEQRVAQHPHRIAAVYGNQRISYAALNQRANQLALRLHQAGIGQGDLVSLLLDRSIDMVVAIYGVLKAAAAYLPLDPNHPQARMMQIIDKAQPRLLITQQHLRERAPQADSIEALWCMEEWLAEAALASTEISLPAAISDQYDAENHAYAVFTSGSTGAPKGVQMQHRPLVNFHYDLSRRLGEAYGEAELSWGGNAPYFFDASFQGFGQIAFGTTLVLIADEHKLQPAVLIDYLHKNGVTIMDGTPTHLSTLLDVDDARLPHFLMGGEKVGAKTWNKLLALREQYGMIAFNVYGPTEACINTTMTEITPQLGGETMGGYLDNVKGYVVGHGHLLPAGAVGELLIGGNGLASGYLNDAELSDSRFLPDRYSDQAGAMVYRSGDLVRYREDGLLEFAGRVDEQVKVRGFRIELGEIESVLLRHEAVSKCAVIVHDDEHSGKLIWAYVVLKPLSADAEGDGAPATLSGEQLREAIAPQLPAYMLPAQIILLDKLPLTGSGKLDRKALPVPAAGGESYHYEAPQGETEERLAQLWEGLLGSSRISRHDSFFMRGGHSLLAVQLVSRVRESFQIELPVHALFDHPSLMAMAMVIDRTQSIDQVLSQPIDRVSREQQLPLSFSQQRLWFLQRLNGPSAHYNISLPLRLRGQLDQAALQRTLEDLVRRHESLRTRIETVAGKGVQVIDDHWITPLQHHAASSNEILNQLIAQERNHPFDIASECLFRACLVEESAESHVLILTLHHIITDGWSLGVMLNDLTVLYRAHQQGSEPQLTPLPLQYVDYAAWQQQWLNNESMERQLHYWRQQLEEMPHYLHLPTDNPRPSEQSYRGANLAFKLPQSLSTELLTFSRDQGATLFMTMLAAFSVLLSRYSGQRDFGVGTPVANRNRRELESIIGFFINTLVMRADLRQQPTFRQYLEATRETVLQAFAHQDIPFEHLVEKLNPGRNLSHSPLFQVMFVLQNSPLESMDLPALEVEQVLDSDSDGEQISRFDLTVSLNETEEGIVGVMTYNADLFEARTMQQLAQSYETLLQHLIAQPDRAVTTYPLLDEGGVTQQLDHWCRSEPLMAAPATTLNSEFDRQAAATPDAVAIRHQQQAVTYREAQQRSRKLAAYLLAQGVSSDSLVAVSVDDGALSVIAMLAVLKAGAAYIPLSQSDGLARLQAIIKDASVQYLIAADDNPVMAELAEQSNVGLINENKAATAEQQAVRLPTVAPEQLAYVVYTSGTTGQPKGVMISHRSIVNYSQHIVQRLELTGAGSSVVPTSLRYDLALTGFYPPLLAGNGIELLAEEGDLLALQSLLQQREHIAPLKMTPSHLNVLDALLPDDQPLPVDVLVLGGESLGGKHLRRWQQRLRQTRLFNHYGPSEATVGCLMHEVADTTAAVIPIGKPISHMQTYVLDDQLELLPPGCIGELYISGLGLARGYYGQPALTARQFVPNPYARSGADSRLYRTGDRVRYNHDGDIEYVGRSDQQLKIRGYRVEPGEIEQVLMSHPQVAKAVVVINDEAPANVQILAYVEQAEAADNAISSRELRQFMQQRLPVYMLPNRYRVIDRIPLNANGKVAYDQLPAISSAANAETSSAMTATQSRLHAVTAEILGHGEFSIEDNFFDIGGHSLIAVRYIEQLNEAFSTRLMLMDLFKESQLDRLAERIDQQQAGTDSESAATHSERILPLTAGGHELSVYCLAGAGGQPTQFVDLAGQLQHDADIYALKPITAPEPASSASRHDLATIVAEYQALIADHNDQPYWLVCHSAAALIGCQLAADDRSRCRGLILLDPPAPVRDERGSDYGLAYFAGLAVANLMAAAGLSDTFEWLALRGAGEAEIQQAVQQYLEQSGLAIEQEEVRQLLYQVTVMADLTLDGAQPIAVEPVLIVSAERSQREAPQQQAHYREQWSQCFTTQPQFATAPGNHFSMLAAANVQSIADLLRQYWR